MYKYRTVDHKHYFLSLTGLQTLEAQLKMKAEVAGADDSYWARCSATSHHCNMMIDHNFLHQVPKKQTKAHQNTSV